MIISRTKKSFIFSSDLYALSVSVQHGIFLRLKSHFVITENSITTAHTHSSIKLHRQVKNDDVLYSDATCRYALFRDRSLRFTGSDEHPSFGRPLLCDFSLLAGKRVMRHELYAVQGMLTWGEESFYFAPAHSHAVLLELSDFSPSIITYAALNNDELRTVLLLHILDENKALLDVINQNTKHTVECYICKTEAGIFVSHSATNICVNLQLTPPNNVAHKNNPSNNVLCVNGRISLDNCNDIIISNRYFFIL